MKKHASHNMTYRMYAMLSVTFFFSHCMPPDNVPPSLIQDVKTGLITQDETWGRDRIHIISGRVIVKEGVILTIEPGTVIKGKEGDGANASVLLIARGARLLAEGTAERPIVFTSELDDVRVNQKKGTNLNVSQVGLWGGVIILGRASVSVPGGEKQIEGIPADVVEGRYGGGMNPKDDDNSGILRYVSIRHGGAIIGANNEINGLTLGGVGTGTTIDHIEVVGNKDDGIEWFGGSVNASDLLVWGQRDDGFDIDEAYSGTIRNVVYIAGPNSDHALEIDGPAASKKGKFTLEKGTFKGNKGGYADFRDGAMGTVKGLYFFNYGSSATIELDADGSSLEGSASEKQSNNPETSDNFASGDLTITGLEFASSLTDGRTAELTNIFFDKWSVHSFVPNDNRNDEQAKAQAKANKDKFIRANKIVDAPQNAGADITAFTWTYAYEKGALEGF